MAEEEEEDSEVEEDEDLEEVEEVLVEVEEVSDVEEAVVWEGEEEDVGEEDVAGVDVEEEVVDVDVEEEDVGEEAGVDVVGEEEVEDVDEEGAEDAGGEVEDGVLTVDLCEQGCMDSTMAVCYSGPTTCLPISGASGCHGTCSGIPKTTTTCLKTTAPMRVRLKVLRANHFPPSHAGQFLETSTRRRPLPVFSNSLMKSRLTQKLQVSLRPLDLW